MIQLRRILIVATAIIFISTATAHADALSAVDFDSIATQIDEVSVTAIGQRRAVARRHDGSIRLDSRFMADRPAFMGVADPVVMLRSMPEVATTSDLQASINVRGSSSGSNLFQIDGVRVVNPVHVLGLFSVYNPAFYRDYEFRASGIPVSEHNLSGGWFNARSFSNDVDTVVAGTVNAGLIASYVGVAFPLKKGKADMAVALRQTYLSAVFPNLLKLGTSRLSYDFTDVNLRSSVVLPHRSMLRISAFANRDAMKLYNDHNGSKDGSMGWYNFAAGVAYECEYMSVSAGYSAFRNSFRMSEGGKDIDAPSRFRQINADFRYRLGDFRIQSDFNVRMAREQRNRASCDVAAGGTNVGYEWNVAGEWSRTFAEVVNVYAGLRLSAYHCGNYNTLMPQPRVRVDWNFYPGFTLYGGYGRYVMFDLLVEETNGGLPADFRVNAGKNVRPSDNHSFNLGLSGVMPVIGAEWSVEGYYKRMMSEMEFAGALLDLVNDSYNPVDDLLSGSGYAAGVSVSVSRQWGKLRGSLGYNFGVARLKIAEYGKDWFPSSHDRRHDLNVSLSWNPLESLTISGAFTFAGGLPYTRAKYGYMIGENLICEYYPHNSSRLPCYKRLDVSATWVFLQRGRMKHSVNVSVYNALASHNVLFTYTSYSLTDGIRLRESVMKNVIPSISYCFSF